MVPNRQQYWSYSSVRGASAPRIPRGRVTLRPTPVATGEFHVLPKGQIEVRVQLTQDTQSKRASVVSLSFIFYLFPRRITKKKENKKYSITGDHS